MRRAATDGVLRVKRQEMGLALVDPATVVFVTDRNTCAKAERAYSGALKGNGVTPSGSVYVVKVGSRYVVRDPAQFGNGWYAEMVIDGSFRIAYRMMA